MLVQFEAECIDPHASQSKVADCMSQLRNDSSVDEDISWTANSRNFMAHSFLDIHLPLQIHSDNQNLITDTVSVEAPPPLQHQHSHILELQ